MNGDDWFCRIDGKVDGPLTARRLMTMAAIGELLPTDEVRDGLGGSWQSAKSLQGLQFGSTTRISISDPEERQAGDYRYKMVQIPPNILVSESRARGTAAATYLENIVNEHAVEGWEFYRVDSIGVRVQPGCLMVLFGSGQATEVFYVVTFRRPS